MLKMLYSRDFKPAYAGEYYRELPAGYSPAEAGWEAVRTTEASLSFFDQGIQKVKRREIGAGVALVFTGTIEAKFSRLLTPN